MKHGSQRPANGPVDLYRRLHCEGPADRTAILTALNDPTTDPGCRQEAAIILLDPHRRQVHDDFWKTASTVMLLRRAMGLEGTVLWNRWPRGDFAEVPATRQRFMEAMPRGPLTAIHAASADH
jgi:hypothetical protein